MKVLVTGKGGTSGSWKMRGEQLGVALCATVKPHATMQDISAADVSIVVKRTPRDVIENIRASGRPWVFDVVDCYPQPESSGWERHDAIRYMREVMTKLQPTAVIWPTQKMRTDCDDGRLGIVLPHHSRRGIARNPVRKEVKTVAYEGRPDYLNGWKDRIESECSKRGWSFVVNPGQLADADVVVAFRGPPWDGYVSRSYKSAVKLANAHASGTPFIGARESGYLERATGCEYWADDARELGTAMDWLRDQSTREQIANRFVQATYTVERAAAELRSFLVEQFA